MTKVSLDSRRAAKIMLEALSRTEGVRIKLPNTEIALRLRDRFYKSRKKLNEDSFRDLIFTISQDEGEAEAYLTIAKAKTDLESLNLHIEDSLTGEALTENLKFSDELEDFTDLWEENKP